MLQRPTKVRSTIARSNCSWGLRYSKIPSQAVLSRPDFFICVEFVTESKFIKDKVFDMGLKVFYRRSKL